MTRPWRGANIGAGAIFANYDGVAKHHTTVGAHSFVGSDSVLIAQATSPTGPTSAGSAVTTDVGPGQIAVARGQQRNIAGWVASQRAGTKTAAAAGAAARHTHTAGEADRDRASSRPPRRTSWSSRVEPTPSWRRRSRGCSAPSSSPPRLRLRRGEIYVRYEESVRGSDAFVIQSHSTPTNEAIMERLIMIDALKRLGQADHRGPAVLRLRPPGQEAPWA